MAADLKVLEAEPLGEGVVEALEEALVQAKAGKLSSVAIALVYRDGCTGGPWSAPPSFATLVGSVEILRQRLVGRFLDL